MKTNHWVHWNWPFFKNDRLGDDGTLRSEKLLVLLLASVSVIYQLYFSQRSVLYQFYICYISVISDISDNLSRNVYIYLTASGKGGGGPTQAVTGQPLVHCIVGDSKKSLSPSTVRKLNCYKMLGKDSINQVTERWVENPKNFGTIPRAFTDGIFPKRKGGVLPPTPLTGSFRDSG